MIIMVTYQDIKIRIKNIAENYTVEPTGGWITGDGIIPSEILFVGEAPEKQRLKKENLLSAWQVKLLKDTFNLLAFQGIK